MKYILLAAALAASLSLAAPAGAQPPSPPREKMPNRHVPPPTLRPVTAPPPEQIVSADSSKNRLAGTYVSSADPRGFVIVSDWSGAVMSVLSSRNWESIGYLHEGAYTGVLRMTEGKQRPVPGSPLGFLRFEVLPEGGLRAQINTGGTGAVEVEEVWTRSIQRSDTSASFLDRDLPALGDYVFVEELPEAITKERPRYPERARREGIEGTVMVQALVGKDGAVVTTQIGKSIPALDEAATQAVAKWKFKPAMSKGAPVAVWVAVPVQFTLK